jgi:AAA+ superfamily predicted ATPase
MRANIPVIGVRTAEPGRLRHQVSLAGVQSDLCTCVWDIARGCARVNYICGADKTEKIIQGVGPYDGTKKGPEAILAALAAEGNTPPYDLSRPVSAASPAQPQRSENGQGRVIELGAPTTAPGVGASPHVPAGFLYILEGMYPFLDQPVIRQFIKNCSINFMEYDPGKGKTMVLLLPREYVIPEGLSENVYILDAPLPCGKELYLHSWLPLAEQAEVTDASGTTENPAAGLTGLPLERLIGSALGLTFTEAETAFAWALRLTLDNLCEGASFSAEKLAQDVVSYKTQVLKKSGLLELMPPVAIEAVGGLERLKLWLRQQKEAYTEAAKAYGIARPRGILVCGPPGTGKSLIAKATAGELGFTCVKLDIGKTYGSLVGQSEQNIRAALKTVEAMAPCVLLLDEVDKGFGQQGGERDGGTSSRVFGTLLTWLQERDVERSPVFVVMSANRVDGLPPELLRPGRLDGCWSVDYPTSAERRSILRVHLEKTEGEHRLSDKDYEEIAAATEGFSGAELEGVLKEAIKEAFYAKSPSVTKEHVLRQAAQMTPQSQAFPERIAEMRNWASRHARRASEPEEAAPSPAPVAQSKRLLSPRTLSTKVRRHVN